MKLDAPLDDLFASASSVRVLRALVELPAGFGVSTREIARRAGLSHPTASRVLASLASQGVATVRRSLRGDEYALEPEHVLAQKAVDLFAWERSLRQDLIDDVSKAIVQHAPGVERAFLYGSAASGEMLPDSDIDLAIESAFGRETEVERQLQTVRDSIRRCYGNQLNILVGSPIGTFIEGLASIGAPGSKRSRKSRIWERILREGIPIPIKAKKKAAGA